MDISTGDRQRTVVIADDNLKILALAARILDPEYQLIARVADGEALVEAVESFQSDAAVVDIDMPRLNGGSDTYAANEGIAFNSIVAAFKAIKGLSGNS